MPGCAQPPGIRRFEIQHKKGDEQSWVVVVTWGLWFINLQSFKFKGKHGEVTRLSPRGVISLQRTIAKDAVFVFNCWKSLVPLLLPLQLRRRERVTHKKVCAIPLRNLFPSSKTKRCLTFTRVALWKTFEETESARVCLWTCMSFVNI